jgi:hypothetical protein
VQTVESEIISRYSLFLERNKFTILRIVIDSEHFGNEVLICSSPHFRLKLVKDRGEIFMEISSGAGKPWYPLEDVLKVALGGRFEDYRAFFTADPIGALEACIPLVAKAIHVKEREIAAFGHERAQKVAQDIFGNPLV